jgi:hypothetical protein
VPSDLLTASFLLLAASGILAWAGVAFARRVPRRAVQAAAVVLVAFIVLFVWRWSQAAAMARLVPYSGAVVMADFALPATAMLAGIAWSVLPGGRTRRAMVIVPLVALCAFRTFRPLAGATPEPLGDRWSRGVCIQTSTASCSAAAAATLLRAHGIDATESEMAELCLTRDNGTPMLGVYRGLVLKTRGTPWRVEILSGATNAALAYGASGSPALLSVGIPRDTRGIDPRYQSMWGWMPGVRHTVVAFRLTDDRRVEVGDPAVGREHWSAADLHVLWHGEGLKLVRR